MRRICKPWPVFKGSLFAIFFKISYVAWLVHSVNYYTMRLRTIPFKKDMLLLMFVKVEIIPQEVHASSEKLIRASYARSLAWTK